jgi:hypothetical protein
MSRVLTPLFALLAILIAAAPAGAAVKAQFGKSVVLKPVGGSVLVKEPGERRQKIRATTTVRMGSEIDTTRGKVRLTSSLRSGKQQSARFNGAPFRVSQPRRQNGLTDLKLVNRGGAACPAGANAARRGGRLLGSGRGRFRTRGRNSSATVRGTTWATEDGCNGTSISNIRGKVQTEADDADLGRLLDPGQTVTYFCKVRNASTNGNGTYCILLLSEPDAALFGMGIAAITPDPDYFLCLNYPDGTEDCADLPLSEPDPDFGFRQSAVACFAKPGPGVYTASWWLDEDQLEPSLRTPRLRGAPSDYPNCIAEPAPAAPAGRRPDPGAGPLGNVGIGPAFPQPGL